MNVSHFHVLRALLQEVAVQLRQRIGVLFCRRNPHETIVSDVLLDGEQVDEGALLFQAGLDLLDGVIEGAAVRAHDGLQRRRALSGTSSGDAFLEEGGHVVGVVGRGVCCDRFCGQRAADNSFGSRRSPIDDGTRGLSTQGGRRGQDDDLARLRSKSFCVGSAAVAVSDDHGVTQVDEVDRDPCI